jgi:hypothetical protein
MSADLISLADRRHSGLDLEFYDQVAAELGFGREMTADLRSRLLLLDARMRRGCEESERCWRLLRAALVDAIPIAVGKKRSMPCTTSPHTSSTGTAGASLRSRSAQMPADRSNEPLNRQDMLVFGANATRRPDGSIRESGSSHDPDVLRHRAERDRQAEAAAAVTPERVIDLRNVHAFATRMQ